jgi:VIT1/CCC1 family predicted Fe2+/Mn2+ transporter
MPHRERHRGERIGWLRAAVLGANDGIVSTASLVVGVAASAAGRRDVLVAGVAGLVAGAFSTFTTLIALSRSGNSWRLAIESASRRIRISASQVSS